MVNDILPLYEKEKTDLEDLIMKLFRSLVLLMLAVSLMFTMAACGDDNNDKPVNETTDVTTVADETTDEPEDDKVAYTVTVVDENNAPISGAMVQMCLDACIPSLTNDEGVATFNLEEAEYKVSFVTAPAGYAVEEAYYFDDGSYEMTITLKAAA